MFILLFSKIDAKIHKNPHTCKCRHAEYLQFEKFTIVLNDFCYFAASGSSVDFSVEIDLFRHSLGLQPKRALNRRAI